MPKISYIGTGAEDQLCFCDGEIEAYIGYDGYYYWEKDETKEFYKAMKQYYEGLCKNTDCSSCSEFGCTESKKVQDNCNKFIGG